MQPSLYPVSFCRIWGGFIEFSRILDLSHPTQETMSLSSKAWWVVLFCFKTGSGKVVTKTSGSGTWIDICFSFQLNIWLIFLLRMTAFGARAMIRLGCDKKQRRVCVFVRLRAPKKSNLNKTYHNTPTIQTVKLQDSSWIVFLNLKYILVFIYWKRMDIGFKEIKELYFENTNWARLI